MEDRAEIGRLSPVEIKTILVPTDLRPESMIALRYALTLAKQFDANLTLLHVLQEPYTSDTELEPSAEELTVLKKNNEERKLALLEEEWKNYARSIGIAEAVFESESRKPFQTNDSTIVVVASLLVYLAGLLKDQLNLTGGFWDFIGSLNDTQVAEFCVVTEIASLIGSPLPLAQAHWRP